MSRNYKGKIKEELEERRGSKGAKSSKKGANHRNNNKPRGEANLDNTNRDNDPNHYFVSAELAQQAAQLSFRNILGSGYAMSRAEIPTISVLALNPCPGESYAVNNQSGTGSAPTPNNAGADGINLIDVKLYTLLSTFSGRTSTYSPCDVGIMELAIASIAEFSEHLRRAFGVALTYNTRNRTLPKELIKAMGIDPDDLFANISAYRMRFNTLMTQINQIPLLDNVKFVTKSRELYQKVYSDAPGSMAQLYVLVPNSVWELDETTYSTGSVLKTIQTYYNNSVTNTMGWHLDVLENMINKMLYSTTLQVVYADLLNLANKMSVPMWQFDYLAENYVVMPEYNINALLQIHHMTPCDNPLGFTTGANPYGDMALSSGGSKVYKVTPNNDVVCEGSTGTILYNPIFDRTKFKSYMAEIIVDMFTDAPSVEDIIEALRFSTTWSGYTLYDLNSSITQAAGFITLPDHYCTEMYVFGNIAGYANAIKFDSRSIDSVNFSTYPVWEAFEAHPLFYYWDGNYMSKILGDVNFYTTVDYNYLVRVNRLMFEGLFDFRVKARN